MEVAKSVGGAFAIAPVGVDCNPELSTEDTEVVCIEYMKVTTANMLNNLMGVARKLEIAKVTV